ncbi:uncharacterized protein [Henckelia pumila]|uniref:uncharacterized protein n=1 Tax=Henckelia pumila TaxID=405737 RepID=UPI003C6E4799
MAMSLEDFLAEEGFQRRKTKIVSRNSTSEGRPSVPLRVRHEASSSLTVKKREKIDSESQTRKNDVQLKRRGRQDSWDDARSNVRTSADSQVSEITEVTQGYEIVEVGNNSPYKDIYLNKVYGYEENESRNSAKHEERERYMQLSGKNMVEDKKNRTNSFNHPLSIPKRGNTDTTNWKIMNQPPESSAKKNFDENKSMKQPDLEETLDTPALDEAAVKAIISILSGYIRRFLKDEYFRTSLSHNSFASLNFIGLEEGLNTESKVIENLEQAIETVERAAEDSASVKELKKASLQLSVITGLNSKDLKDGFTSGIPNLKFSACAHLYLSVIYVIQKKDKITAKHILQVFRDSPFQARVALLPDLWDHVFLPNLLHLKLWYDKDARSVADLPVSKNINLLDKVYNETLDSGTHQFAKYYKDWLTEDLEAPSLPVIKIPSFSVQLMPKGGLHGHTNSPASYVSPQPMVSKKLYDEVFSRARKMGFELEIYEEENFEISARSSNSPAPEDKQLILYDSFTSTNQCFEPNSESLPGDICVANETHSESSLGVTKPDERYRNSQSYQKNIHTLQPCKLNVRVMFKNKRRIMKSLEINLHFQASAATSFHSGNDKEKTFILPLLLCCIEANEECRNDLSINMSKSSLLDLLYFEQLKTVSDAVSLLTKLICLNRRRDSQIFLEGVDEEQLANAMDDLLIHLKTCTLEETPAVAILILHLNILKKCSRALLVLGGCFSSSGKLMTEDWILKLAGFLNGPDWDITDDDSYDMSFDGKATMNSGNSKNSKVDSQIKDSEEEKARESWLVSLSASLLEDGTKPFLETVCKCLNLGNSDLVRVCLVTMAWLSSSLASLPDTEFQLYAFSALISPLKK